MFGDTVARKGGRVQKADLVERASQRAAHPRMKAVTVLQHRGSRRCLVSRLCCAQCVLYGPAKKRMMRELSCRTGVAVTSVNT